MRWRAAFSLLRHDYSLGHAGFPAVYDFVNRKLYVRKTAEVSGDLPGRLVTGLSIKRVNTA